MSRVCLYRIQLFFLWLTRLGLNAHFEERRRYVLCICISTRTCSLCQLFVGSTRLGLNAHFKERRRKGRYVLCICISTRTCSLCQLFVGATRSRHIIHIDIHVYIHIDIIANLGICIMYALLFLLCVQQKNTF